MLLLWNICFTIWLFKSIVKSSLFFLLIAEFKWIRRREACSVPAWSCGSVPLDQPHPEDVSPQRVLLW